MTFNANDILADLVLEQYNLLVVIERFGIRLGIENQTIYQVCQKNSLNPELFCIILNMFCDDKYEITLSSDFSSIPQLLIYLEKSHNYFLGEKIPEIQKSIAKLVSSIEEPNASLIVDFFDSYIKEVNEHMAHENSVVFHYVNSLYQQYEKGEMMNQEGFSMLEYEKNHDDIEQVLFDLKNLLLKYLPQNDIKDNRINVLIDLFELEHELHNHQRIEDELLIPMVRKLEDFMTSKKLLNA